MQKIELNPNVYIFPMPVTLLGTRLQEQMNFMTLAWITRVNASPPLIAIGVNRTHMSFEAIKTNREFSINYPRSSQVIETDYCGIRSMNNTDKSNVFTVFDGKLKNAPMIEESSLSLECRVIESVDLPSNTLFIADILFAYSESDFLTDGQPDITKMDPILLTMPDNGYWTVGERIGTAWKDGRTFRGNRD